MGKVLRGEWYRGEQILKLGYLGICYSQNKHALTRLIYLIHQIDLFYKGKCLGASVVSL